MNKLKLAAVAVCLPMLLAACAPGVPDAADLGPNPGGGFFTASGAHGAIDARRRARTLMPDG